MGPDIDAARIDQLKAGKVPIYEAHLDKIRASAAKAKNIFYTTDAAEAIRFGEAIFICVGTPPRPDGSADLSAIDHVAQQIAAEARSPKLVVEKSTAPARTGIELQRALSAYSRGNGGFRVASNPGVHRESTSVEDFLCPAPNLLGV